MEGSVEGQTRLNGADTVYFKARPSSEPDVAADTNIANPLYVHLEATNSQRPRESKPDCDKTGSENTNVTNA